MAYRYLEDVAIADAAFEADGATLEELFRTCVDAALGVMVTAPESVRPRVTRNFSAEDDSLDLLLVQLLQEIVFRKDAERLFLRCVGLSVRESGGRWTLCAELAGEPIDPRRHELLADVKAVTMHLLKVERTQEGWSARVVLDV
jgi:SHS2 domain-containing protein